MNIRDINMSGVALAVTRLGDPEEFTFNRPRDSVSYAAPSNPNNCGEIVGTFKTTGGVDYTENWLTYTTANPGQDKIVLDSNSLDDTLYEAPFGLIFILTLKDWTRDNGDAIEIQKSFTIQIDECVVDEVRFTQIEN